MLVPVPAEQDALRDMAAWRADGASYRAIVNRLNKNSVAPKQCGRWHPAKVSKALARRP